MTKRTSCCPSELFRDNLLTRAYRTIRPSPHGACGGGYFYYCCCCYWSSSSEERTDKLSSVCKNRAANRKVLFPNGNPLYGRGERRIMKFPSSPHPLIRHLTTFHSHSWSRSTRRSLAKWMVNRESTRNLFAPLIEFSHVCNWHNNRRCRWRFRQSGHQDAN